MTMRRHGRRVGDHFVLNVHAHLVLGGVGLVAVEFVHEAAVLVHAIEELVLGVLVLFGVQLLVVRGRVRRELHEIATLREVHFGVEATVLGEVRPVGYDATRHAPIVLVERALLQPRHAEYVLDLVAVQDSFFVLFFVLNHLS